MDTPRMEARMNKRLTLTPKQSAFAGFVASGDPYVVAYRKAYNTLSAGKSVAVNASRLAKLPHVLEYIEKLKEKDRRTQNHHARITKEWVLEKLQAEAIAEKNPASVRVRALELIGKNQGMFTEGEEGEAKRTAGEIEDELSRRLAGLFDAMTGAAHQGANAQQDGGALQGSGGLQGSGEESAGEGWDA